MDYGKFKYEQSKRERTARKKQHVQQLKEVKLRPKIDDHDFDFKIQHAREFLAARDKVKVTLTFRGREMAHPELGHQMMQRVIADLADVGSPESIPRSEGRTLVMVVMPKPAKTGAAAPKPAAAHANAAANAGAAKPAGPAPAAKPATAKPPAPVAAKPAATAEKTEP
jgi:translation initiation factor IF-3